MDQKKLMLYGGVAAGALVLVLVLKGGGGGGSLASMQSNAAATDVAINGQVLAARTAQAQVAGQVAMAQSGTLGAIAQAFINSQTAGKNSDNALAANLAETNAGVRKTQITTAANVQIAKVNSDAQITLAPIMANEQVALAKIAGNTTRFTSQQSTSAMQQMQQSASNQDFTSGLLRLGTTALPSIINAVSNLFSGGGAASTIAGGVTGGLDLAAGEGAGSFSDFLAAL